MSKQYRANEIVREIISNTNYELAVYDPSQTQIAQDPLVLGALLRAIAYVIVDLQDEVRELHAKLAEFS